MSFSPKNETLQGGILYASLFTASTLITKYILDRLNEKEQKRIQEIKLNEKKELERKQREKGRKIPKAIKEAKNCLIEELKQLESPVSQISKVGHLAWELKVTEFATITSPLLGNSKYRSVYGGEGFLPDDSFVYLNSYVLSRATFGRRFTMNNAMKWVMGGPRKHLFFQPSEVKAAIVTCGGLCPGLNVVIREIVMCLHYNYKVPEVWGVQFGYRGFYSYDYVQLTPQKVKTIQHLGGTMLGSSRGGFDAKKIVDALVAKGFNQLYVIGGDGTHAGILELCKEIKARSLKIGICGLPKTIDNDIPIIDKSFGFETSVEESLPAIHSAYVESHCCEYGVGLVRLMGRSAGFIAMEASLASRDVNICLVPEFKFELNGPNGLLQYIADRLKKKRHCVIVVAEGAGEAMLDGNVGSEGVDASGHVKAADIGIFIKDKLSAFCKKEKIDVSIKYVDPTYMIRSVAANPSDRIMCSLLAQNAVHGLMAGFTFFSSGIVNHKPCFIPIEEIISKKYSNRIQPHDRNWHRLLQSTGQPSFLNEKPEDKMLKESDKN